MHQFLLWDLCIFRSRSLSLSRTVTQFIPLNDYDASSSPFTFYSLSFRILCHFLYLYILSLYPSPCTIQLNSEMWNSCSQTIRRSEVWSGAKNQIDFHWENRQQSGGREWGSNAMRYTSVASQCNHNMWMPNISHEHRTQTQIYRFLINREHVSSALLRLLISCLTWNSKRSSTSGTDKKNFFFTICNFPRVEFAYIRVCCEMLSLFFSFFFFFGRFERIAWIKVKRNDISSNSLLFYSNSQRLAIRIWVFFVC